MRTLKPAFAFIICEHAGLLNQLDTNVNVKWDNPWTNPNKQNMSSRNCIEGQRSWH